MEWFEDLAAEGKEVRALKTKPELFPDLIQDWMAFWQLSQSRQNTGFGLGAIPLSEIVAYLQLWEIADLGARVTFMRRMQLLDSHYLKLTAPQPKKK